MLVPELVRRGRYQGRLPARHVARKTFRRRTGTSHIAASGDAVSIQKPEPRRRE